MNLKEVTGSIKNNGSESIFKVTVRVRFFSESNRLLNEKFYFISNLDPLHEKDFKVVYEGNEKFYDEVNYYKVDITDYILN